MAIETPAQSATGTDELLVWQTGPDTLSGRYLRRFWQPIFRSEDLQPGYAVPVRILSERFTLYRGEAGAAHIVAFRCAHRGTQLSSGTIEEDCLRCVYHGWKYAGDGQCVEQPREDPTFAARIRIPAYPTREYLGLIWGFFGEGEPPLLERHPDFEGAGILDLEDPEYWPCNFFNRVDNACDIGHVAYTHAVALQRGEGVGARNPDHADRRDWFCQETAYGIKSTITFPGRPDEYFHYHMPLANQNSEAASLHRGGVDAEGQRNRRISWRVPIDDENTVSFSVNLLQMTPDEVESFRERRAKATAADPTGVGEAILAGRVRERDLDMSVPRPALFSVEDYVTQVGQGPVAPREYDHLGKVDHGVLLLRKIWERELRAFAEGQPLTEWAPKSTED